MAEFRMPALGADMEFGTLIAWHMAVGDHVAKGDVVAEVDTDKSVIDVETFTTGTVEELLVEVGTRVPVGTPLARIREDDSAPGSAPAAGGVAPVETAAAEAPPSPPASVGAGPPGQAHHRASPLARRHAKALGVDLADVTGTGPDGAVTTADVERHAAARDAADAVPAPSEESVAPSQTVVAPSPDLARGTPEAAAAPLSGADRQAALRRAVAASMARSKREIPHYYLSSDIDMSRAVGWLTEHNVSVPVTERLLPAVLLLKATALALRESPDLNGLWEGEAFHRSDAIHLGMAVALRGGGLVAPAIHDADTRSLPELMAALRDLVARARSGRLRSSEMSDPTVTVTSLGDQGVDAVLPVIYPPQVAIVGFGRIRDRAWAVDGLLGVRPVLTASLAADHRVTDGHIGALFLTALDRLLQRPEDL
ncbi:dihydrolipoamide acetyltransferase family protein [Actinotalea sp.]|uniref:dihydrolipoamide acetyltransferase family protein n=1 Tax=Actinotalea sp. TaxID=1872145 RepID=UPI003568939F